jgi:hypothetical protein
VHDLLTDSWAHVGVGDTVGESRRPGGPLDEYGWCSSIGAGLEFEEFGVRPSGGYEVVVVA